MPTLIIGKDKVQITSKQYQQVIKALKEGKDIKVKNQQGKWINSQNKTVQMIKE